MPGLARTAPTIAAIVLAAALPVPVFLLFGPPTGDSFQLNLSWGEHFSAQLLAGELYPRWLHGLNHGAGSPAFFFYAPVPFWIGAAADAVCAGCTIDRTYILWTTALIALSGLAFFAYARTFAGRYAAAAGALLYMILPYHYAIDFWHRSALGELAAYLWMPIVLLGLTAPDAAPRRRLLAAAGYAGLILSHLPSALLFSPVMALYALIRLGIVRGAGVLAAVAAAGIGLSALYLVPALTMQGDINAAAWWRDAEFLATNWLWLDGRDPVAGPTDQLLAALLIPTAIALLAPGALRIRRLGERGLQAFVVLALVWCWFLMTAPSSLLWQHAPLLDKVQFPWRVGIVVDLCAAMALTMLLAEAPLRRTWRAAALGLAVLAVAGFYGAYARTLYWDLLETEQVTAAQVRESAAAGFDAEEYLTRWYVAAGGVEDPQARLAALAGLPDAEIAEGAGSLSVLEDEIGRLRISVDAEGPVEVVFGRFFFPGWRLYDPETSAEIPVEPAAETGLARAAIPAGSHRLVLERTMTRAELAGLALSAASLAACLLMAFAGPRLAEGFGRRPARRRAA